MCSSCVVCGVPSLRSMLEWLWVKTLRLWFESSTTERDENIMRSWNWALQEFMTTKHWKKSWAGYFLKSSTNVFPQFHVFERAYDKHKHVYKHKHEYKHIYMHKHNKHKHKHKHRRKDKMGLNWAKLSSTKIGFYFNFISIWFL